MAEAAREERESSSMRAAQEMESLMESFSVEPRPSFQERVASAQLPTQQFPGFSAAQYFKQKLDHFAVPPVHPLRKTPS